MAKRNQARSPSILCDTGPLIALIDQDDADHLSCVKALKSLPSVPLLTTWPCYTEAMYFLQKEVGYRGQQALWRWRKAGRLLIHQTTELEADRMEEMMAQYQDAPMDLADASLMAAAESLNISRILTIDRHFYAYRTQLGQALEVFP